MAVSAINPRAIPPRPRRYAAAASSSRANAPRRDERQAGGNGRSGVTQPEGTGRECDQGTDRQPPPEPRGPQRRDRASAEEACGDDATEQDEPRKSRDDVVRLFERHQGHEPDAQRGPHPGVQQRTAPRRIALQPRRRGRFDDQEKPWDDVPGDHGQIVERASDTRVLVIALGALQVLPVPQVPRVGVPRRHGPHPRYKDRRENYQPGQHPELRKRRPGPRPEATYEPDGGTAQGRRDPRARARAAEVPCTTRRRAAPRRGAGARGPLASIAKPNAR